MLKTYSKGERTYNQKGGKGENGELYLQSLRIVFKCLSAGS
jgi:hypothetical protein